MRNVSVFIAFTWVGFVSAISFMEAWLKFRAPGVDLKTGLSIGNLVFNSMNKVEWVFFIFLSLFYFLKKRLAIDTGAVIILLIFLLLILQTTWLLPDLSRQAEMIINGKTPETSNIHIIYVVMEFIKVPALLIFGVITHRK
ncbi:MAG: hypothetical protein K9I94_13060, partial [Bacteroidales bacterium]|nr:hypothetical protein [Bacteroidales bacterium]